MSRVSFRYWPESSPGGRITWRPVVILRVRTRAGQLLSLSAYLDSGADLSVFPSSDLELLDLSADEMEEVAFTTASGDEVRGRLAMLRLEIAGQDAAVPVAFCEGAARLVGRAGVFEGFYVVFDEAGRRVHFFSRDDPQLVRVLTG